MHIHARKVIGFCSTLCVLGILLNSAVDAAGRRHPDTQTVVSDVEEASPPVELSWNAPSTRTNGEYLPLSEIQGYNIYYGNDADNLSLYDVCLLDDVCPDTNYTFQDLEPGIYYFAVTTLDAEGLESNFSEIVSKEVL